EAVNAGPQVYPVGRGHLGPSVLRVQVLLDRALFSSGMLDGRWGRNTQNAVYWLQAREGLPATGVVDSATYLRLQLLAGRPAELVRRHTLTAEDVRGPFRAIPGNIYEHARLSCSCYESLTEKLTESFHLKVDLLQQLNPGVSLNRLRAGDALNVPAVRDADLPPVGQIAALVVSGTDNYVQAMDAGGRILYHFAATLGSSYDPSPQGDFRVTSVHENPWWRYQPRLLAHVDDSKPEAMIPPGPNSAVGRVWMSLSAPHYGIHGTKSPETIGYAQSAGCVRLTNWDALYLGKRIPAGTPVQFRGTRARVAPPRPAEAAPAAPAGPALLGVRADSARADPTGAAPPTPADTGPAPQPAPAAPVQPAPAPPAPAPAPRDSAATP
ncbi:MAG TPA: L,D-transpeptidase family protein, partial [Longimicrobiaceae bacterium]|nr:L,D-transpeptidase family protein [Longimicrobiaceae bacterium]